ncbi:MAG: hypothetical protein KJ922_04555, partial [Nanoarchaeota archaeon]|nr:hypothetical protein [Nanoarchaeota archaeon]
LVFGSATVLKKHSEGLRQSLPADLDAVLLDGVDHFPPVARLGNLAESMYRKSLLGIAAPDAVVNYFRNLYTSVRAYEKVTGRTITTNG